MSEGIAFAARNKNRGLLAPGYFGFLEFR